ELLAADNCEINRDKEAKKLLLLISKLRQNRDELLDEINRYDVVYQQQAAQIRNLNTGINRRNAIITQGIVFLENQAQQIQNRQQVINQAAGYLGVADLNELVQLLQNQTLPELTNALNNLVNQNQQ